MQNSSYKKLLRLKICPTRKYVRFSLKIKKKNQEGFSLVYNDLVSTPKL